MSNFFGLKRGDESFNDALEVWLDSAICGVTPGNGIPKIWTEPTFDNEVSEMILK